MDEQAARDLLKAAVRKRTAAETRATDARKQLYDVVRTVSPVLKQVDIVKETGWTREHVRNIVDGKL